MNTYKTLIQWWLSFTLAWAIYRLFSYPEWFSEIIAKPNVWLGITWLYFVKGAIPRSVSRELSQKYLQTRPFWLIFVLPAVAIVGYFLAINYQQILVPPFSWQLLLLTLGINFSTATVEEIVYRGVLYVWLLQKTDEVKAFMLVQVLFVLAHVPILVLNFSSFSTAFVQTFFIILMGMMYTLVFRSTKSLYASILTHGIWNSLVAYFLLS